MSFDRYSSYSKLLGVTSNVLKFASKIKDSIDFVHRAKIYLLKIMQRQCFGNEIEFARNPKDKRVPDLVRNLNLYLDPNDILRCDGRI